VGSHGGQVTKMADSSNSKSDEHPGFAIAIAVAGVRRAVWATGTEAWVGKEERRD
jgi:hypothetical protein